MKRVKASIKSSKNKVKMQRLQTITEAFVFTANKRQFTCIRKDVLHSLRQLGDLHISIANESINVWGFEADDIAAELNSFGLNWNHYRYRDEAALTTKQLQALINLYLSFSNPDDKPEVPTII